MKIQIDLDGTTYHFDKTVRYMLKIYRGVELKGETTDWWWIRDNAGPENWAWLWDEGIKLGLFRYGHVMKGAIEGINSIARAGHDVEVCTHRPASAVKDTLDWLAYVNLPFSGVHILSNGESKATVPGDVLVDDKPENVLEWVDSDEDRWAILFVQPWNSTMPYHPRILRAHDWPHVVELVNDLEANYYSYQLELQEAFS